MDFACFDIETIPSQSLPEGVTPEFDPNSVKLGNVKDPTKIQEKVDAAKKEFDEALDKKMSLDPDLCDVVCFVCNDKSCIGDSYEIVNMAWEIIQEYHYGGHRLVSYNGIQFDLPVLLHSAMKFNIPVPPSLYLDLTKKYNNVVHSDLMQILAGWDRQRWKPLSFYLKLFSIGEKTGDGSQVYGMWKKGEYEKIREYCEEDVRLTTKLFERLSPWIK